MSIRLFPYAGVAVNRKSLGLGNTLIVSRGYNLIRLAALLALFAGFILVVQWVINSFLLGYVFVTINAFYGAIASYTRLFNSGVTGEWVYPFFVWLWQITKILVNIFWILFSYGTVAGLYGRLYRESERGEALTGMAGDDQCEIPQSDFANSAINHRDDEGIGSHESEMLGRRLT